VNSSAAGSDAGGAGSCGALVEVFDVDDVDDDPVLAATAGAGDDGDAEADDVVRSNPNSSSAAVVFGFRAARR
jgi:hypothetical protein